MRIVLAEDEKKTRNGILHIIEQYTDHTVIGLAENGEEGYRLVKEHQPDLLISDIKMPVMDGLEMLEKLYREKSLVHTILLTGYSDFEYARKAIKFQVLDYLLKPLDAEELLRSMAAAETHISNVRISQSSVEQLLARYLDKQYEEGEKEYALLSELLQVNEKTELSLFLVSPRKIFNEHMKEYLECADSIMKNLCIDHVRTFQLPGEKQILILVAGTEKNKTLKQRFEVKIMPELDEIGQCTCIYEKTIGLQTLPSKVKAMQEMLFYAFSIPENTLIDHEKVNSISYEKIEYPQHLENFIIRELRNGKKSKIWEYGEVFIKEIVKVSVNPDLIKEYAIRLLANVFHVAKEIQESFSQEETMRCYMEAIISGETLLEIRYQLEKLFRALSREDSCDMNVENGIVMNAISYIREHYKEEIALSDVARSCRVTPEYLSRIFNNETGINFSHFIQKFRISMAKRMLLEKNCKVYEVAEAVGFRDQKYFVKIFKKLCGVTPSEYRKEFGV